MSDIADKIYASTGLTLGAEAAAAIGRLIQVENEKLRAKQADRIAELEAAVTQCRTLSAMLKPQADRIAELEAQLAEVRGEYVMREGYLEKKTVSAEMKHFAKRMMEKGKKDE